MVPLEAAPPSQGPPLPLQAPPETPQPISAAVVLWRGFEAQTDRLFRGFRLRENWVDWIIDNHVRDANPQDALHRRRSIGQKIERARHLYINGDLTWQGFTKIKDEAEAALVSIYIPEFDDAVEAGKFLNDFGTVWESASVGRKNRLLKSMLQAIYVDLEGV